MLFLKQKDRPETRVSIVGQPLGIIKKITCVQEILVEMRQADSRLTREVPATIATSKRLAEIRDMLPVL